MKMKQGAWGWMGAIVFILALALGAYYLYFVWGVSKPLLTSVRVKEDRPEKYYSIDVHYPQVSGLRDPVVEKLVNEAIKKGIDDQVADFVQGATTEVKRPPFPGAKSDLQISYSVEQLSPKFKATDRSDGALSPALLSLLFRDLPYYAGAIHPNGSLRSLNFDLRTGKELALSDLFRPQSEYLKELAKIARTDLNNQFEPFASKTIGLDEWIVQGTDPTKPELYSVFALRQDGLLLVFNAYQVAPYVFGERLVTVPWTALGRFLIQNWKLNQP